jgi:aldose sugar dehydrogenase
VILRQEPKLSTGNHFGSRLGLRPRWLPVRDPRGEQRPPHRPGPRQAARQSRAHLPGRARAGRQPLSSARKACGRRSGPTASVTLRVLALNPWSGTTLGKRTRARAAATRVNIIERGKNYGWPLATHGINYSLTADSRGQGQDRQRAPLRRTTSGRNRRVSAAWRSTTLTGSRPGSTTCLSARIGQPGADSLAVRGGQGHPRRATCWAA